MITFVSFASRKGESDLIKEQIRRQAGLRTEEQWKFEMFERLDQAEAFLRKGPLVDLVSWDVTVQGAIESLEMMRSVHRQALLLVIADTGISPLAYLKPGISPSSLVLKPVRRENLEQVASELLEVFTERFESNGVPDSLIIDTREGKQYIPFDRIYYIEAREKKIYIRTRQEEYGFYETIENMEKNLPDYFLRCHRSYIVNMAKVQMVKASQNLIGLRDQITVPLSRSYKKNVKDYNHDRVI